MHGRHEFWEWLKQPGNDYHDSYSIIKAELMGKSDVLAVIFAWWITFTITLTIVLGVGFGRLGVGAGGAPFHHNRGLLSILLLGTVAAIFQSMAYGALTPAGGIFATLTSIAMTDRLSLPAVVAAAILATTVAGIVWVAGVGSWLQWMMRCVMQNESGILIKQ